MSLHRRITAAATLAVAAVCLVFGPVAYLYTRAKLFSEIKQELMQLAPKPQPHGRPPGITVVGGSGAGGASGPAGGSGPAAQSGPGNDRGDRVSCASPQRYPTQSDPDAGLGGPTGYFQSVCPDGRVLAQNGGSPKLPVTQRVRTVARTLRGAFFFSARVQHHHLEIYVVPDRPDRKAVEVAVPLTTTDSALHGLLIFYALLMAGGVLLAGVIGAMIARSALAPIRRFTNQTEQVTSSLDTPRRLEEEGATEIRRLAASFNQTLSALERSVEAQRHLIADASHELRTPISALRSNIQIFLEADQLPPEEQAGLRDAIIAELDDLTQLVSDVLELARGSSPGEHVEELELDAIVREAIERARRRSPQLTFDDDLEQALITNSADRVSRAVANVIDNARRWSPDGASVSVTLRDGVLTVRDHGPGFREEDLPHVFERFYRSADARRMPGSGLGLAIVKQAAEAHGGSASVTNAADGGAIVRVTFGSPTNPGAAAAQHGSTRDSAYPGVTG